MKASELRGILESMSLEDLCKEFAGEDYRDFMVTEIVAQAINDKDVEDDRET
jgi:hypothetical protein